jgi:hypothetical protein
MATTQSGYAVTKPASAPSAAAGSTSGNLDQAAAYNYKVTFATAFGETEGNATAANVTTTSTGSVVLTSIPTSTNANVIKRKIYRTVGGGSSYLLAATISDNTTTTYTDTLADGSLGAALPTINNAHSRQSADGQFKFSMPVTYSIDPAITATAGGGQANAYQLTSEVNVISVCATAADSVKLPELNADLIGVHVLVANNGANSANVFPASGQNASGGVDTAVAVAATARAEFVASTASVWVKTR